MNIIVLTPQEIEELHTEGSKTFDKIYRRLYLPLFNYAKKLSGSKQDGEELVHDAFVALWNHRRQLDSYENISSYLFTTIVNAYRNILKHRTVVNKWFRFQSRIPQDIAEPNQLSTLFIREVYAEIEQLPAMQKKILLLSLEGLPNKDIAAELQISENNVSVQKNKALRLVKLGLINKGYVITALLVTIFGLKYFFPKNSHLPDKGVSNGISTNHRYH